MFAGKVGASTVNEPVDESILMIFTNFFVADIRANRQCLMAGTES